MLVKSANCWYRSAAGHRTRGEMNMALTSMEFALNRTEDALYAMLQKFPHIRGYFDEVNARPEYEQSSYEQDQKYHEKPRA